MALRLGEILVEKGIITPHELQMAVKKQQEKIDWSNTDLFQTIRVVATGTHATPPLFDTLEAIGEEKVVKRLQKAIKLLS